MISLIILFKRGHAELHMNTSIPKSKNMHCQSGQITCKLKYKWDAREMVMFFLLYARLHGDVLKILQHSSKKPFAPKKIPSLSILSCQGPQSVTPYICISVLVMYTK